MGSGASLVLVGWMLRELGPRIRDRAPAEGTVLSGGELVLRMAWSRFCGACGMAMLLCGLLILLVTGILTVASAGDDLGTMIVLGTFALSVVLMLLWTLLYVRQFGTMGIFRKKQASQAPKTAATDPAFAPEGDITIGPVESSTGDSVPFEQAATSRGGFGRFSGFLRNTPPAGEEAPQPDVQDVSDEVQVEQPDDKRLDPSDPLVPDDLFDRSEQGDAPDPEDLVIEELGGTPVESTASDEPAAADDAIATLRKRRLDRLAGESETE